MSVVQVVGNKADNDISVTATLSPAAAGNVLWAILVSNRASSNLVVPTGFTEVDRVSNGGGCNYVTGYKVAAGGETDITYNAGTGLSSRLGLTVYELDNIDTSALPPTTSTSTTNLTSSYTSPAATGPGMIIAGVSLDNATDTPVAWVGWTDSFTEGVSQSTLAGSNNIAQSNAYLSTASSGPFTTTQEWASTNAIDVCGGIAVFTESAGGPIEFSQSPTDDVDLTDSYVIEFNGAPLGHNEPQFVGYTSHAETNTTTVTIPAPTGLSAGDQQFLLFVVNTENDTVTDVSSVSGTWTLVASLINPKLGGADVFPTHIYSSIDATGDVVITKTNTVASEIHGVRLAYSDVSEFIDFDLQVGHSGASQAATHPIPGLNTTVENSKIVIGLFSEDTVTNTFTAPVGFTSRIAEVAATENLHIVVDDQTAATLESFSGNYTSSENAYSNTWSVELVGTTTSGGGSGVQYTEDPIDAEDITDEIDKVVSYSRPSTDTVGLTDEVTVETSGAPEINVTDNVGITDDIDKEASKVRVDSVNITDSRDIQKPQAPSNDTGITDEFSVVLFRGRESTDPVAVSDIVSMEIGKTRSDHIFVEDEVIMARSISFTPTDDMGITDEIVIELPDKLEFNTTIGITDLVTVTHIANTRKASNISLVDDRRVIVQTTLILSDEQTALLTITDLAYQYWSDLSGLTPVEAQSMYDHFKDADPDGKHWIESIK